jgi:TRAP-type C4-dicarboxylate transport system substrate-binding protein
MSWTEIYTAMQQGVIDGLSTMLSGARMIHLEELVKYVNTSKFFMGWSNLLINEKFYQSLSPEDKYLVKSSALDAMTAFSGLQAWEVGVTVGYFEKHGVKVYFPTPDEEAEWAKLKPHMIEWTKKKIGSEWVDKVIKASEEMEKKLYGD